MTIVLTHTHLKLLISNIFRSTQCNVSALSTRLSNTAFSGMEFDIFFAFSGLCMPQMVVLARKLFAYGCDEEIEKQSSLMQMRAGGNSASTRAANGNIQKQLLPGNYARVVSVPDCVAAGQMSAVLSWVGARGPFRLSSLHFADHNSTSARRSKRSKCKEWLAGR